MNKNQPVVLVIDDESAIRDMIKFALEQAGMLVQSAANAHQALLAVSERRPDMILMDWMMPGVSGMELFAWLRDAAPDLSKRMVFMTGGVFTEEARTFLEGTPNLRVEKPFDHDELLRIIRGLDPNA